ncbi:SNF2-related protein [Arcanobacterium hippocoleae]
MGWFVPWLNAQAPHNFSLSYVIADEAHYVKNQDAKRSQRTSHLLQRARMAVLLTGTPMENNPNEFRTLIRYIHPHLAGVQSLRPLHFRKKVAPIYLRRTQADVLDELPP